MKRTTVALACVLLAVSGLAGCAKKQTTDSLDQQNSTKKPSPIPTMSLAGIGNIDYCVGQAPNYNIGQPVTIAIYRDVDLLGKQDTTVGKRVDIPIAAGSFDVIVDNTILYSGVVKDGQTYKGQSGRLCQN